jgi:hypothetical protein
MPVLREIGTEQEGAQASGDATPVIPSRGDWI